MLQRFVEELKAARGAETLLDEGENFLLRVGVGIWEKRVRLDVFSTLAAAVQRGVVILVIGTGIFDSAAEEDHIWSERAFPGIGEALGTC